MKLTRYWIFGIGAAVLALLSFYGFKDHPGGRRASLTDPVSWQRMASPGALSRAHSFLEHDCGACHTPVRGVEAVSCVLCHANAEDVLQRQPSSFHADVRECGGCHGEHRGVDSRITSMDHRLLARIGLGQLNAGGGTDDESRARGGQVKHWIGMAQARSEGLIGLHPKLRPEEAVLDCSACHQNDDRHFGLFGNDCAACHETTRWTLPDFRHPSSSSLDCSQCHQAPPSHYMEHFRMISATVAGQPHARVEQCFLCHQTTSWNDIRRVGVYKHH